jgi:hypothetical protein
MSTWLVVAIIVLVLVFIVSMMTALLYSKPIQVPKEHETIQDKDKEKDESSNPN